MYFQSGNQALSKGLYNMKTFALLSKYIGTSNMGGWLGVPIQCLGCPQCVQMVRWANFGTEI